MLEFFCGGSLKRCRLSPSMAINFKDLAQFCVGHSLNWIPIPPPLWGWSFWVYKLLWDSWKFEWYLHSTSDGNLVIRKVIQHIVLALLDLKTTNPSNKISSLNFICCKHESGWGEDHYPICLKDAVRNTGFLALVCFFFFRVYSYWRHRLQSKTLLSDVLLNWFHILDVSWNLFWTKRQTSIFENLFHILDSCGKTYSNEGEIHCVEFKGYCVL